MERRAGNLRIVFDRRTPPPDGDPEALKQYRSRRFLDEMLSEIRDWLVSKDTTDIVLNPDGKVWATTQSGGTGFTGLTIDPVRAKTIIELVATLTGEIIDKQNPILSAEMPGTGFRFEANIPPVVVNPTFCIRMPAAKILTWEDYLSTGTITVAQMEFLQQAVMDRQNIVIAGGTGSGKTTLINTMLMEIAKTDDRIVIIEDTRELNCPSENHTALRTTDTVDMTALLKTTMRQTPRRIIVGEVRDKSAIALLKAWNSGHPGGVTSVHASGAELALNRLNHLILEGSASPLPELIRDAVDYTVFMNQHTPGKRRIEKIVEVTGYDKTLNEFQTREIAL